MRGREISGKERKRKEKKGKERKEKRKESIRGKERKEEEINFEISLSSFFLLFLFSHREGLSSMGHEVDFCVRVFGKDFFKGFQDASHRGEEGIPGIFLPQL